MPPFLQGNRKLRGRAVTRSPVLAMQGAEVYVQPTPIEIPFPRLILDRFAPPRVLPMDARGVIPIPEA